MNRDRKIRIYPIAAIRNEPLRWLAIAGGTVLAVGIFISPTFIPTAIAATCAVRYADTMKRSKLVRFIALAIVAVVLIVALVAVMFTAGMELAAIDLSVLILTALLAMFRASDSALSHSTA